MNLFRTLIDNIKFPVIIWKITADDRKEDTNANTNNVGDNNFVLPDIQNIKCIYSNSRLCKIGVCICQYALNNNIHNYDIAINKLLNSKTQCKQYINLINKNIVIDYLDDFYFYEIHYPINNNNNLLYVIITKFKKQIEGMVTNVKSGNDNICIENINKLCYDMIGTINDMYDIYNIYKNKLTMTCRHFTIVELIDNIINTVRNDIVDKNITIYKLINASLDGTFYGDYGKIKQIIINIISNSIKFTNMGSIYINVLEHNNNKYACICYGGAHNENTNVLFIIKDTGNGIDNVSQKQLNYLFNMNNICRFNSKIKLNGFGLFISHNLCKFIGGTMWFETAKDVGTIFYVIVPLLRPNKPF